MTFFNKKEEILELKLSSYGRQKLAAGSFKPTYYAFFDDDVLYDGSRGGISEDNNDIEPRIQENSPSLRCQTNFTDLEAKVRKQTHDKIADTYHESNVNDRKTDPSVFQDYDGLRNVLPLGKSQLGNQYTAAWRVEFMEGDFNSSRSTTYDTSLSCAAPFLCQKPIINIPQVQADVEVQPVLVEKDFKGISDPQTDRFISEDIDGTFIRLVDDYILLDISEANVDLYNDSFSLEVYEITEDEDKKETLVPKMFKKQIQSIVNGILLDQEEIEEQISEAPIDEKFVEYYFDISVDNGIDNKTKKDKIFYREKRGNIFDSNIDTQDYQQTPGTELYTSDNDGEDC